MRKKRERHRESWKEELTRIRESFTEQKKRDLFEKTFSRPPLSDSEVDVWFDFYTIELYNNGRDVP